MAHEGMVHALRECRRALTAGGLLLDLRPFAGNWPLEVVAGSRVWAAGTLDDSQEIPDDRAANAAMADVVRREWFRPEQATTFEFAWYWTSLAELEEYIAARWSTVMRLAGPVRAAVRRGLAEAGPGARVRFRRGMLLGRYRRVG